jgi:hypothetical protein
VRGGSVVQPRKAGRIVEVGRGGNVAVNTAAKERWSAASAANPSEHVASRSSNPSIGVRQALRGIAPSHRPMRPHHYSKDTVEPWLYPATAGVFGNLDQKAFHPVDP